MTFWSIIILQMGKSRLTFFPVRPCHMKILELPLGEMWDEFVFCDVLCGPLIPSTLIPFSTSLLYSWAFFNQGHSKYKVTQYWACCFYTTTRFVDVLKQFFSGVTVMMQLYLMGLTTAGKLTKTKKWKQNRQSLSPLEELLLLECCTRIIL